jgi:hypothetical protein
MIPFVAFFLARGLGVVQPGPLALWTGAAAASSGLGQAIAGPRDVEDRAALANLELQREAGMPVFTDGEVRRASWLADLLTMDDQRRKLELVVDTARRVWG